MDILRIDLSLHADTNHTIESSENCMGTHTLSLFSFFVIIQASSAPAQDAFITCGWFGNDAVVCSPSGSCDPLVAPGAGGLGNAHSVTIGPDGLLYVTSISSNSVLRYNAVTGDFQDEFITGGVGNLTNPTKVAFGPADGLVYVTSFGNNRVKVYDPDTGAFIETRVTATNANGLSGPESLIFGPDGHIYVASRFTNSIKRYDAATGAFLGDFVTPGLGGLTEPFHMAFSDDGSVFYVGSSLNNTIIAYNGADGSLISVLVKDDPVTDFDETGGLITPHDVTIGPDGRMYVASFGSDEIIVYDTSSGVFIESFPSTDGPQEIEFRGYNYVEEDVQVLQTFTGDSAGDQFGWVSALIEDLDGDGRNDLIITAPTNDVGGNNAGQVYVYSSNPAASPHNPIHVLTGTANLGQFGYATGNAGDLNDDGISDIQVGAPFSAQGSVFLYSGADGLLIATLIGENSGDQYGISVCPGFDYNGDGIQEILVGAPKADPSGMNNAGKVYVYDGATRALLRTYEGEDRIDKFGSTVAPIADQNGDGHPDLLIGAPAAGDSSNGRVYLYSGLDGLLLCTIDNPSIQGVALSSLFLSSLGDVNNDGKDDIYFTDFASNSGRGKAYVYSYDNGLCSEIWSFTGTSGSGLGIGNGTGGDVNNDGYADVLVGIWQLSAGAPSAGGAILYSGKDRSVLREFTSTVAGETFGFDIHTMGDVTGDGVDDLLSTAAWNPAFGTQTGRVYLIAGVDPTPPCLADFNGDGSLNFFDISAFLTAFSNQDPSADFTGNGTFNFFDISAFLQIFVAGCQ